MGTRASPKRKRSPAPRTSTTLALYRAKLIVGRSARLQKIARRPFCGALVRADASGVSEFKHLNTVIDAYQFRPFEELLCVALKRKPLALNQPLVDLYALWKTLETRVSDAPLFKEVLEISAKANVGTFTYQGFGSIRSTTGTFFTPEGRINALKLMCVWKSSEFSNHRLWPNPTFIKDQQTRHICVGILLGYDPADIHGFINRNNNIRQLASVSKAEFEVLRAACEDYLNNNLANPPDIDKINAKLSGKAFIWEGTLAGLLPLDETGSLV